MRPFLPLVLAACTPGYEDPLATDGEPTNFPESTPSGGGGLEQERFLQPARTPVDLLLVVDDSSGMGPYQGALGAAYDDLIGVYQTLGVDLQVGLISTDVQADQGRLIPLPNGDRFATAAIDAGTFATWVGLGQSGRNPDGITAALAALEPATAPPENAGFHRDAARLEVVVLSNHDVANPTLVLQDLLPRFAALEAEPGYVRFNAVVNFPGCCASGSESEGTSYAVLAGLAGGDVLDLQTDFAPALGPIAARNDPLPWFFTLAQAADPATLHVFLEDPAGTPRDAVAGSWQYEETYHVVAFASDGPSYGEACVVEYAVLE